MSDKALDYHRLPRSSIFRKLEPRLSRQKKNLTAKRITLRQKWKTQGKKITLSSRHKREHGGLGRVAQVHHGIRKCSKGFSGWSSLPAILEHLKGVSRKMFCCNCGQKVSDDVNYCSSFGKGKVFIRYYILFYFFTDKKQSNWGPQLSRQNK